MKINNFGTSGINPYKSQMNKLDKAAKTTANATDKIEISSTAKEMQQVSHYAASRQAKVDELKIQIENGNYKVNPNEIANSILNFYKK
ncbi:negative regulator of flagellin synthesis FlgM [Cytobacillus eiseniae]|uniref:Negative regulator of flagellin synthesis n=1 Tax=Cytobacillus eiseniae TaxID=762947 RepID=A0ABS4RHS8_9BACI|nr:flagellar biosynthesis anti-sigma factor FlgM [Cytobacillus eiseniae]MBP2241976.1 negative regulator of flagellin synthesis FlgM [Cytobacillus eiseniae]